MSVMENTYAKIEVHTYTNEKPYFGAYVYIGEKSEDELFHCEILKMNYFDKENAAFNKSPEFGSYVNVEGFNFSGYEEIDETHPSYQELVSLREKFKDLHENAPYVIHGAIFSEVAKYSPSDVKHRWPRFDQIASKEWFPGEEVKSIEDAEKWLLKNHPDYYMGFSASQQCPSGSVVLNPHPCVEYPTGMFETLENRQKYARMMAEKLGVKIGNFELDNEDVDIDIPEER